ncbi:MAG: MGMT family protein [Gammaproteobacteria bacterium]|nr:MGMT family protein [Gammaproteobacteria bacterium]
MTITERQYDVVFDSSLATIGLQFDGSKLVRVKYLTKTPEKRPLSKAAESVKNKIQKYLDSQSVTKQIKVDVRLDVTPFQERVLKQLQKIPYGETRTYGEIAKILKTSPRAVGNACRRNPLPIIIPCHRVTAANGIGGYDGARSGRLLNIKHKLLEREGVYL